MKNSVYVRKNEIPKEELKKYVQKVVDEKEALERDFNDDFSSRYILVSYKGKGFYFDKETSLMFPIFNQCTLKKYNQREASCEEIIEELKELFYGLDDRELLSENDY